MMSGGGKGNYFVQSFSPPSPSRDVRAADALVAKINSAIAQIFDRTQGQLSFQETYQAAYNLVVQKQAAHLYDAVCSKVEVHVMSLLENLLALSQEDLPAALHRAWMDFKLSIEQVGHILMYLDQNWVRQQPGKRRTSRVGVRLFGLRIARNPAIRRKVISQVLAIIDCDRRKEAVDLSAVKGVADMFIDMGSEAYREGFESHFLQATQQFFAGEASVLLTGSDCNNYLQFVARVISEEESRCSRFASRKSVPALRKVLRQVLLEPHASHLLNMQAMGLRHSLRQPAREGDEHLRRMFTLLGPGTKSSKEFLDCLTKHIQDEGIAIFLEYAGKDNGPNKGASGGLDLVRKLLALLENFLKIVNGPFAGSTDCQSAVNEAITRLLKQRTANSSTSTRSQSVGSSARADTVASTSHADVEEAHAEISSKIPEHLSVYLDRLLSTGAKVAEEQERESRIRQVTRLFRFVDQKDVFLKFYHRHLGLRLLYHRSAGQDTETVALQSIADAIGGAAVWRAKTMLQDVQTAHDTNLQFCDAVSSSGSSSGMTVSFSTLMTGAWPSEVMEDIPCRPPAAVVSRCKQYESWYTDRHKGRKLNWRHGLGIVDVKFKCKQRAYSASMPAATAMVLLCFNKVSSLTANEAASETTLPLDKVRHSLVQLCAPKCPILLKEASAAPSTNGESSRDAGGISEAIFKVNESFSYAKVKFKVAVAMPKFESPDEQKETMKKVAIDRSSQLDAAIVRVMKSRKKLGHSELTSLVVKQVCEFFMPQPVDIKKRIEELIEKEYLERAEDDQKTYHYLA